MIEMLITLTLFGLVMSSLVVAMNTGVGSWRRIHANQSRYAAMDLAFEKFNLDVQHMARISDDIPTLVESAEENGGERLIFTMLGDRHAQWNGHGSSWAEVEYRVVEDEATQSRNLIREMRPRVGPSSIVGAQMDETLLEHVATVQFDYLSRENTVPIWEDQNALPVGIKILVRFESGRTVWHIVMSPTAHLQNMVGP